MTLVAMLTRRRLPLRVNQNVTLIAAGLLLGLLLAVRWQGIAPPPVDAPTARQRAAQAVRELEREQEQLKAAIAQLREELAAVQRQAAQNTARLTEIQAELQRERAAAGLVRLVGPGVVVQLDDSAVSPPMPGSSAESYIIHEYDLRDVVNLLWSAGVEAIAINDERLVNTTSIYCVGSTVMVNDTRLSPPYLVRAIGERKAIEALLDNPAHLAGLRQRVKACGVQMKVSWSNAVEIPAYSGTFRVRHAHAGEVRP